MFQEFELWKNSLPENQKKEATGFFNVIRRKSEIMPEGSLSSTNDGDNLCIIPYSVEYKSFLTEAANLLHKAGDLTSSPRCYLFTPVNNQGKYWMNLITHSIYLCSLKRLLHGKATSFLSNDYYDSDLAWMELVSMHDDELCFASDKIINHEILSALNTI